MPESLVTLLGISQGMDERWSAFLTYPANYLTDNLPRPEQIILGKIKNSFLGEGRVL